MLEVRRSTASSVCTAALGGARRLLLVLAFSACAILPRTAARPEIYRGSADGAAPGTCAWFGAASKGVLYFGESAFWASLRAAGGKPGALRHGEGTQQDAEPQRIGRFDLRARRFLPPLVVDGAESGSGTWDVLVHPNGRVYFTTFFGPAGAVDPESGRVWRFPGLGRGLNELALGPGDSLLATRYGDGRGGRGNGAVVEFSPEGQRLADLPLGAPPGWQAAGKSLAFDPVRREIWVNTDLLPAAGGKPRHDVRVLGLDGRELLRIDSPEVEFMTFSRDGTGYFAEREGRRLRLRIRPPERAGDVFLTGRVVPLDDDLPAGDFVQDIQPLAGGGAVVTRWSGHIDLVDARGGVRSLSLPREAGGLYYTGVLRGDRLCATLCQGITVVCAGVDR